MSRWSILTAAVISSSLAAGGLAARSETVASRSGTLAVETVARGLAHPWGLAFLPDGRMLVTERPGTLRIVDGNGELSDPVQGTPEVFDRKQGGLMDVALGRDFAKTRLVYLSFAEPGESGTASTALGRGRLADGRIEGFEVIFRQAPKVSGGAHFGNRIVWSPDGTLFLTLGERFKFEPAQDPANHLGAVVRLNPDGSVPQDNPFVGREDAEDAIWSYGHRNIEAAAVRPGDGQLWVGEMGPRGGDELNLIRRGANYGWPAVSWGRHYDGRDIPDPPTRPEFADAVHHWTPVISPSGMVFYTGELFAGWRGDALIGGLSSHQLVRVRLDGDGFDEEERIPLGARIRDVEQGPDGAVYVLTDEADGTIRRLRPLN